MDDQASSLSLENLGGSQDNLSLLGRNPDKEMRIHTGRKSVLEDSIPTQNTQNITPNNDRYLDNREIEEMERRQRESMSPIKSQYVRLSDSNTSAISAGNSNSPAGGGGDKVSFADLRKQKARDQFHSSGINITYTEQEKEDAPKKSTGGLLSRRDSTRNTLSTSSDGGNIRNAEDSTSPAPGKIVFVCFRARVSKRSKGFSVAENVSNAELLS